MKTKLIILVATVVFLTANFIAKAQDENLMYYLHQKENTEQKLKDYILNILENKHVNIKELSSDVYVNFIPPHGCPRCEGSLEIYNQQLKKATNNSAFIINVLLYNKEKALQTYITQQHFTGDVLYVDGTDIAKTIFLVNQNKFIVPYTTKINFKDGRLILSQALMGSDISDTLIKHVTEKKDYEKLVAQKEDINANPPLTLNIKADKLEDIFNKWVPVIQDSIEVAGSDTIPWVTSFKMNKTGNNLVLSNYVTSSFIKYSKSNNKFTNPVALSPTPKEDKMFIDKNIPSLIYQYLRNNNVLVSMYLNADFINNDMLYIMASLPKVVFEIKQGDTTVGYYNEPVCLLKNDNKIISMGNLVRDFWKTNPEYDIIHTDADLFYSDNLIVLKITKGWPARGVSFYPPASLTNIENPFHHTFYEDVPTLLFYNTADKTYSFAAPLENIFGEYKLGYYYSSNIVKKFGGKYWYANQSTGKIYKFSDRHSGSGTLVSDLFSVDTLVEQLPFKEDLSYFDSYKQYFYKSIIDFDIVDEKTIVALVTDNTYYYIFSEQNGIHNICPVFPQEINNLKLTTMQFGKEEKVIYGLYQNSEKVMIYTFEYPKWLLK